MYNGNYKNNTLSVNVEILGLIDTNLIIWLNSKKCNECCFAYILYVFA